MRKAIIVDGIKRGGKYSHAVVCDSRVFLSGQLGFNGHNQDDFSSQFEGAMKNISKVLSETGKDLSDISKLVVYIKKKEDFVHVNEMFEKYFPENPPARTTIVCGFHDDQVLVELDATV